MRLKTGRWLTTLAGMLCLSGCKVIVELPPDVVAGAVGAPGELCPSVGELACDGNALDKMLRCGGDRTWVPNGTCGVGEICDTLLGPHQGMCKTIVAACADRSPGDVVCDGLQRIECGAELGETTPIETCPYACAPGGCIGVCAPNQRRCVGLELQYCDAQANWQQEGSACTSPAGGAATCVNGGCGYSSCMTGGPGVSECGPYAESCCASPLVPGGTYNRSNDPAFPATVADFRLDKFEITVGRFRRFVEGYPGNKPAMGAGAHPFIPGSGWDKAWDMYLPADQAALRSALKCPNFPTWTDTVGDHEGLPMNCINWYEAFAFCAWDGGRLPTEAEWNYAAAGGGGASGQRAFPWGDEKPAPTLASYGCKGNMSVPEECVFADILKVGSRSPDGDGRWNQADLAGSLYEWVLDSIHDWNPDWVSYYPLPCDNCAVLLANPSADFGVIRGGGWYWGEPDLASSWREDDGHEVHDPVLGARCAREP